MSVYAPLYDTLVKASAPTVTYSFDEIELVLGRKLPGSARSPRIKRQWWANTDTHVQARAWLRAGRKARLDVAANRVAFVRDEARAEQAITIELSHLDSRALQALKQKADEANGDLGKAATLLLNELAYERRRTLVARLDDIRGRTRFSGTSVVDLIREDRDGR